MVRNEDPLSIGITNPFEDTITIDPFYFTEFGAAYFGESNETMEAIPDNSVNLIVTSPPYALVFKKEYGNVDACDYVEWFLTFTTQFHRILTDDGSLVINVGGSWNKGNPTRSTYHFQLLLELSKIFNLAQEFYWYNPAKLPSPAEWVNVQRIRVKDSVELIIWLSKNKYPKADNRNVLLPYSDDMKKLITNGYRKKKRPSGHNITENFRKNNNGSIPPNLLQIGNTDSSSQYIKLCKKNNVSIHPARFPVELPNFFIKFLTNPGDVVLDPFCGSNVTGYSAQINKRQWIGIDNVSAYLNGSKYRFPRTYSI